jgi:hypothetical protein
MVDTATAARSMAHKTACEAETTRHRARELLALDEAAVTDLAVRVRGAHERSQDALSRQEAALDRQKDAERVASQAASEEQDSRRTLETCQRQFENAKAELKTATKNMTESGKKMNDARRDEFEAAQKATRAAESMRRCDEATEFLEPLARKADGVATLAEGEAEERCAKFPPDFEGLPHAAKSRKKQVDLKEQSNKSDQKSEEAHKESTQKEQERVDAKKKLDKAEGDHDDKVEKHLDCAAEASKRQVELEGANVRHREAAEWLVRAKAQLARATAFHQQEQQLYLDRKAIEDKLSAEQAAAQSALERAKKAADVAAQGFTSSRQHLSDEAGQMHISRKRAECARLRAMTNRDNQAWAAEAEKQARLLSMSAADHGLASQEEWALHSAAHEGVCAAEAAAFERAVDDEKAVAIAARNADVAEVEAASLDFRADVIGRVRNQSPIARRWRATPCWGVRGAACAPPAVRLPAALEATLVSAGAAVPTICFGS